MDGTLRPTKVGERVGGWVALFKANRRRLRNCALGTMEGSVAHSRSRIDGTSSRGVMVRQGRPEGSRSD